MFFLQKPHKRLAINVSRIEENRYNARKKIIGHRCNTTNISVDKILLKSNFIKIGAILDGLPIIAFGSSETPQIIDTAVVANIPNKIAPGTFFTINKIVNKMPKIVINEVALVIVPKSRGIPFPCLTSPA